MSDPGDLARVRERLEILEAICAALDRRQEVLDVTFESAQPDELIQRLQVLLDVSPIGARAITDMQVRKWTVLESSKVHAERDEMRRQLK